VRVGVWDASAGKKNRPTGRDTCVATQNVSWARDSSTCDVTASTTLVFVGWIWTIGTSVEGKGRTAQIDIKNDGGGAKKGITIREMGHLLGRKATMGGGTVTHFGNGGFLPLKSLRKGRGV